MLKVHSKITQWILWQVYYLDRKYLPGNDLTYKELLNRKVWWIGESGKIIAYLVLEKWNKCHSIRSVVVLPEYRRRGLADRLLRASLRYLKKHGELHVHTYTSLTNVPSMNMLIGLGFKISGVSKRGRFRCLHFRRNVGT